MHQTVVAMLCRLAPPYPKGNRKFSATGNALSVGLLFPQDLQYGSIVLPCREVGAER